jgi:hypothetical protein
MWYYEKDEQQIGPVNSEIIEQLLRNGSINELTPVWRDGLSEWKHLDETDLIWLLRDLNPPTLPTALNINDLPSRRVKLSSLKSLFHWWIALYYVGFFVLGVNAIFWIPGFSLSQTKIIILFISVFVYGALMNSAAILQYIMHYKFWQIVQDGFASTTPGKAIGFLFIPYFNFYWIFRSIYGLAIDLNRYIDRHFAQPVLSGVRKAKPYLSMFNLILTFGIFIVPAIIFPKIMPTEIHNLADKNIQPENFIALVLVLFLIITVPVIILNILTFFDFYKTTESILQVEEEI